MGFPILVRWHLYIESGPRLPISEWNHWLQVMACWSDDWYYIIVILPSRTNFSKNILPEKCIWRCCKMSVLFKVWCKAINRHCLQIFFGFNSFPPERRGKNFESESNTCYRLGLGTPWIIRKNWFRQYIGAINQQAMTWANADLNLCHHMASQGHDDFKYNFTHQIPIPKMADKMPQNLTALGTSMCWVLNSKGKVCSQYQTFWNSSTSHHQVISSSDIDSWTCCLPRMKVTKTLIFFSVGVLVHFASKTCYTISLIEAKWRIYTSVNNHHCFT